MPPSGLRAATVSPMAVELRSQREHVLVGVERQFVGGAVVARVRVDLAQQEVLVRDEGFVQRRGAQTILDCSGEERGEAGVELL